MPPECFLTRWLCGGARAWLPDDWAVGLLTQVLAQAERQLHRAPVAWADAVPLPWYPGLPHLPWTITGGRN